MDLLGYGSNAPNVVVTRPPDTRVFGNPDTWGKDCSSLGAGDGTGILSGFTNGLLGQFRALIRGNGQTAGLSDVVTQDNTDDTMALKAIQHLIQRGLMSFGVDTGDADALVVALNPPMREYKQGTRIRVLVLHDNTGVPAVLNVNGLGNKPVLRKAGRDLQRNDIRAGSVTTFDYDGVAWQLADLPAGFSKATKLITSSAAFEIPRTQLATGLFRTASPAAQPIALPHDAEIDDIYLIEDLASNCNAYPVTVSPPSGHSFAGLPTFTMNINRQSSTFRYYGSNLWSVK